MKALPALSNSDFGDTTLMECSRCRRMAIIDNKTGRTICLSCHSINARSGRLWLSIDTRLGTFYAYNFDHLDYIEAYIRADIRKVAPDLRYGLRNRLITSRLPVWMKAAKNRSEVLKAIDRLRRK